MTETKTEYIFRTPTFYNTQPVGEYAPIEPEPDPEPEAHGSRIARLENLMNELNLAWRETEPWIERKGFSFNDDGHRNCCVGLCQTAGGSNGRPALTEEYQMVVFNQHAITERESMIDPAPECDCPFLKSAPTGDCLWCIQYAGLGAFDRRAEPMRERGDTGQMLEGSSTRPVQPARSTARLRSRA